jgi:hypothetical protein
VWERLRIRGRLAGFISGACGALVRDGADLTSLLGARRYRRVHGGGPARPAWPAGRPFQILLTVVGQRHAGRQSSSYDDITVASATWEAPGSRRCGSVTRVAVQRFREPVD